MNEPQWPESLGWIEVPQGRWRAGRYFLLADRTWQGPDAEAVHYLNSFTVLQYPSELPRPGSGQLEAAAKATGATAMHAGPQRGPNEKPDPNTVY